MTELAERCDAERRQRIPRSYPEAPPAGRSLNGFTNPTAAKCGPWPMPVGWMRIRRWTSPRKRSSACGSSGKPAKTFRIHGRGCCGSPGISRKITPRAPSAAMGRNRRTISTAFGPRSRCRLRRWNATSCSPSCVLVLEELPTADREILTLRYALDYDANTIAERLDIAVTAVHMRLSRARQRLAEKLSSLADFTPGQAGYGTST